MVSLSTLDQLAEHQPLIGGASVNRRPQGPTPVFCVHDEWSLNIYNHRGWIELPDRDERHPLQPGTVCLMPPGTRRQFFSTEPGEQWVVHFQPRAEIPGRLILFQTPQHIRELCFLARSIVTSSDPQKRSAVAWHLLWFINELHSQSSSKASGHATVDRACAHMRQYLAAPLSIAQIARDMGCSHNHLTRLFQKFMKMTVIGWLTKERMEKAKELLSQTDLPVAAVGQEVGLSDPQHFNKAFRRHFGYAPSSIRTP